MAAMHPPNSAAPKKRRKMVHWYDPLLLILTGIRSLLAISVGQITDNRELQAAAKRHPAQISDYREGDELWLDYVSDIGDGFESTNAIAQCLASPALKVSAENATQTQALERGRLLVCGGDLVYPDPSIATYLEATFEPYREACRTADPTPGFKADFFALPGNHDWYDGLQAFEDLICHDDPDTPYWPFGHWRKPQTHSYFSLALPHNWWLLGIDFQLDGRINPSQRLYFESMIAQLSDADRVILCVASPFWTTQSAAAEAASVDWLSRLCAKKGAQVRLVLAGDMHHYSRYTTQPDSTDAEALTSPTLITAGGGGAFLHPTHGLPETTSVSLAQPTNEPNAADIPAQLTTRFPSQQTSRRLLWHNLKFPALNWELSLVAGFVYTLLAWTLETRFITGSSTLADRFQMVLNSHTGVWSELQRLFAAIPQSPEFALIVLLALAALVCFNGECTTRQRWGLGIAHTLFHLLGLCITYCLAIEITVWFERHLLDLAFAFLWLLITMLVIGGGVGGVVFGVFLIVSSRLFNANVTNAFSSIRLPTYKNFLRLHIDKTGRINLYCLGMQDPARGVSGLHLIEKIVLDPQDQSASKTRSYDALE